MKDLAAGGRESTTNDKTTSPEFDVNMLQELKDIARRLSMPIKPAIDDLGRSFYLLWTTRNKIVQSIDVGWTIRAITFGGGKFCLFEPCRIEELESALDVAEYTGYWYDS